MKPLYDLLHDNIKLYWNDELETLFEQTKSPFTKIVTPTLPNSNHPFFITVVSSLNEIGSVPFQKGDKEIWIVLPINLDFLLPMDKYSKLHFVN